MKRIAVMTSGGDAPGMNAAVRAVVRTAMEHDVETYGIRQAFAGLLNGEMTLLSSREVSGILQRGGTILQTARNEEFKTPQGQRKAQRILQEHGIEGVIVIGGDGSLRGAMALDRQGIKVVGVPASIDNDIWGTNMCIGVDTSLNTILDALDRLRDTANSHNRGFVIEVMGRNCGYLALMGGILGGAEIIVTPEDPPTMEDVALALEDAYKRGKSHAIAVISEGAPYRTTDLADYLNSRHTGFEIRITILGHTQRGGSPTALYLLAGQTSIMVGLDGREISTVSLADATTKPRLISPQYFKMAHTLSR
ncbi:MAG: ATP-dependent 6-phosphofructokinase [Anaerolineae bacterium UTCFX5]|nr:MAG: ATP-dependent 6-phosphofructokinase [Anaerolineae bacterium UTCFX5]